MKLFFAHAAKLGQKVRQLDYVGAFLQARCKNRVFVSLPSEYAKHFPKFEAYFNRPLLLKKTIYGLTVSAKWWADELTEWLIEVGFQRSSADPSLYCRHDSDGNWIKLIIYVNDS